MPLPDGLAATDYEFTVDLSEWRFGLEALRENRYITTYVTTDLEGRTTGYVGAPIYSEFYPRRDDVHDLIQSWFQTNSTLATGGGSPPNALFKITNFGSHVNKTWSVFAVLSLGTLNLLGFPSASQSVDVHVDLTLDWPDGHQSGCAADGQATAYAALYWGYSLYGSITVDQNYALTRAAFSKALAAALDHIGQQLDADQHGTKR